MKQKKGIRQERERVILMGLIDLYLETGTPIGSNTLKETLFPDLSSATIRNYFAKLDTEGFLRQHHASGGRTPTSKALKLYADLHCHSMEIDEKILNLLKSELLKDTRQIAFYLQHACEIISEVTECAVFLSAPRFDQDFIQDLKVVPIDGKRLLCVLVSEFGMIHTETLGIPYPLTEKEASDLEKYFNFRLMGIERPKISKELERIGNKLYNEVVLRHVVSYSNFSHEDIYKTGFSKLLNYTEFCDPAALSNGLSIFENKLAMRSLLRESIEKNQIQYWIAEDLERFSKGSIHCSILSIPYYIQQNPVGSIAILGPTRIPYKKLFALMQLLSNVISESLTKSLYTYKVSYRYPHGAYIKHDEEGVSSAFGQASSLQLENKMTTNEENHS